MKEDVGGVEANRKVEQYRDNRANRLHLKTSTDMLDLR